MSFDYHSVAGDYQYRALHSGHPMQRFWHRGKLALIERLVKRHLAAGSSVLEIGCGAGNLLMQAVVRDSFPVALDLSRQALAFAGSRLEQSLTGPDAPCGYACVQAVGETLPLADSRFDCTILSEVIEHLENPETSIREAARVLRPGGRLLVTTPNYRSLWPLLEWIVDRSNRAPQMAGEQHISRFRPASLRALLTGCGLELEYFGAIYNLSPFLSLLSQPSAEKQLEREMARPSTLGMILVAVAIKPRH